jgi:nitroreductase/ketosteroid isomerase-like protein
MFDRKRLAALVPSFFLSFVCLALFLGSEDNRPGLSLKETFDLYIRSIQNSDLKGLFTTVTDNPKFFFLTSRGRLIDTREGYYKFHEEWFKEKEWEMPVDLLEVVEGKDYGYTNAIYHYKSKVPEGGIVGLDSYFTMIFHKEDGMWKVVADVCTPINRYQTEINPEIKYTSDQLFVLETIQNRRTVRKFKPTPVPREHILKILDAARMAPTAGNQQPWKFLVVQNKEKLAELRKEALSWYLDLYQTRKKPSEADLAKVKESVKKTLENVLSAPVYIAVLVDSSAKYPDYVLYDGTLAAGNLMIAARVLGYGTGFFTSFFPEDKMKQFFSIPGQYKLICLTPVGIPEEWPQAPSKKTLEEVVIFESF